MTVATTTLFETPGSFVFTLPSNYVTGDDLLVLRGAGGGGCNGAAKSDGGGGGARATTTSPGYVAGGYVKLTIGAGGSGTGSAGGAGGDTTAVVGAVTFVAKGGQGGTGTGTGGEGGQASACNPTAGAFSGGNGGSNGVTGAWIAGGGGAAGNVANGNPGGNGVGSTQTSGAGGNSGNDDNGGAAVTSGNGNPGGNAAPLDGGGGGGSGSGPANADTGGNGGFPGGGGGAAYSGSSPGGAGAGGYAKLMFGASATPVYPGLTITNALGTVTAGGSVDATVDVTGYAGVPALVWQISGGGASGTVDVSSGTVTIDAGPFTTTGQTLAVASSINPYMTATSTAVTISGGSQTPLQVAMAAVNKRAFGIHVPRGQDSVATYDGVAMNESSAYRTYQPADVACYSYPWTPTAGLNYQQNPSQGYGASGAGLAFVMTPSLTDQYWTSIKKNIILDQAAGKLPVVRLTDNVQVADFSQVSGQPLMSTWQTDCLNDLKNTSGITLSNLIICMVGEFTANDNNGTNATVNPYLQTMHTLFRNTLPQSTGAIAGISGAYWNAASNLVDGTGSRLCPLLPNGTVDQQIVQLCDQYPFYNQGGITAQISAFIASMLSYRAAQSFQVVMMLHETSNWHGLDDTNPGNPTAYGVSGTAIEDIVKGCVSGTTGLLLCIWDGDAGDPNYSYCPNWPDLSYTAAALTSAQNAKTWAQAQAWYDNGSSR